MLAVISFVIKNVKNNILLKIHERGAKMLTFEKGKIIGKTLAGSITAEWVTCPGCLSELTQKQIKVSIGGVSYCVRCAAAYYENLEGAEV